MACIGICEPYSVSGVSVVGAGMHLIVGGGSSSWGVEDVVVGGGY